MKNGLPSFIDVQDIHYGRTALHYAILCENLYLVRLLVQYGANTKLKDSDGTTPLKMARDLDRASVHVKLFEF